VSSARRRPWRRIARAGLRASDRPLGSFLFVGPPGVGKTELARALAAAVGGHSALVRLDLSEYAERHAVARLVGAPPGYVGHLEGGQLTDAVRRRPDAVVLLDEADKAHPDLGALLLQVLDGARLTDGQGRTADFRHALVILTCNAGGRVVEREARAWLARRFPPELLDRLDEIVWFPPLDADAREAIARRRIAEAAALAAERDVALSVDDRALAWLVGRASGADGARPLRAAVERAVLDPLADHLLSGALKAGDATILTVEDGAPRLVIVPKK
jgi:ATP-dependent Clp protease ATP-binding subunit ClpB